MATFKSSHSFFRFFELPYTLLISKNEILLLNCDEMQKMGKMQPVQAQEEIFVAIEYYERHVQRM